MTHDSYGAPQFGLSDVKIATWNATDDYGEEVDVMSAQLMGAILNIISAELEGDDEITATAARAISSDVQLRFGAVNLSALEVLLGNTATSSVASPNEIKQLKISGGDNMPYFGIVGKAIAEEGVGDFKVFLPKVRIMSNVTLARMEYGNFVIPEVTAKAVSDATYGIVSLLEYQAAADIVVPPINIA